MIPKLFISDGIIAAETPYELKDTCKSIPGHRWNKTRRRWEFPLTPTTAKICIDKFSEITDLIDDEIHNTAELIIRRQTAINSSNLNEIRSKITPWQHQLQGYWFAEGQPASLLAMDMGTGKSKIVVDLVNNNPELRMILIVAPVSVLNVWKREFSKHSIDNLRPIILYNAKIAKRLEIAQQNYQLNTARQLPSIFVINYEAVWRQPFAKWCLMVNWDLIVYDEIHKLKAPGGVASRFCSRLSDRAKYRIGLTGTPMPHSPLDIYAQFRALDKGIFGTSFTAFRSQYAEMGGFHQKQVIRFKNQDDLRSKFDSISFQVRKEDVLDLPPSIDTVRDFYLDEETKIVYNSLESQFWAEVDEGLITATNALVKLLRLQQLTSGFLKLDDQDELLQVSTAKQDVLRDIIEGIDTTKHHIVVFTRFIADLDAVREVAENLNLEYGEVSGRRKDIDGEAIYPENIQIMGVQIQAGGLGIDLSRASYVIYYSLGFSLGDYEQSKARVHRPGQKLPVTNIHLIARDTVDERVFTALQERREIISEILKRGSNGRETTEQTD